LTLDSLKEQKNAGGTIHDAIIDEEPINENLQISEFISDIAVHVFPTAVVDDKGKYKGTISKSRLLKVFDEGVSYE
jgi:glycine betaine/proline transport system ATP-binding protein